MIPMARIPSHRREHRQAGTASIEFAILAPILFLMVFGGVDYGMYAVTTSWLSAAARVGSEYARTAPTCLVNGQTPCGQDTSFVYNYTTTIPGSPYIFVEGAISCTCADNSPETSSCPPSGAVAPCRGIVANGVSDSRVFTYDTVTMTVFLYQPMFQFGFLNPSVFLPASSTIRAQ
jgi:Flp pilus assembly protein TadG